MIFQVKTGIFGRYLEIWTSVWRLETESFSVLFKFAFGHDCDQLRWNLSITTLQKLRHKTKSIIVQT